MFLHRIADHQRKGEFPCGFALGSIAAMLNPNDLLPVAPSAPLTDAWKLAGSLWSRSKTAA